MTDNQQPSPTELRTCKTCGETKPLQQFAPIYARRDEGKNYRQHTCLECHRAKAAEKEKKRRAAGGDKYRANCRAYYAKNRDRLRFQTNASNRRLRDLVFQAYGGNVCSCCGETEWTMLTLDHVNEDGKHHRRAVAKERGWSVTTVVGTEMWRWLRDNGFPPGYQVLCYNCNISKHRNGGVCGHQLVGKVQRLERELVEPSGSKCMAPVSKAG